MKQSLAPNLRKLTLSIEEKGGVIFAKSAEFEDMFIAVLSRDELRPAIDICLKNAFAGAGQNVNVYLNCQFSGPTVDAIVEFTS